MRQKLTKTNKDKIKIYIKSILIPVIVGGLVGVLISKFIDYNTIHKPPLSPPSTAFPIAWTILYILMGISYGILKNQYINNLSVLNNKEGKLLSTKQLYYVQLAVNTLWSIIFFIFKWRLFAFIWILILIILVIPMLIDFYKKNKLAGLLQIPYLLWLIFAAYLNLGVYILN